MLHISLFSGVGGFDLASEWMGWKNIVSCEINDFGNKVLEYYWPNAYHHKDIHTLTYETINTELSKRFGSHWRNDDIILTGGFPCQPYSSAGKRKGKEDERHLWPEMLRAIREIQPRWVVGENVLGLVNWSGGLVFHEVQADLEAAGYEVWPYVLPAVSVNAPHRRDRVWFVAYSKLYANGLRTERGMDLGGELLERPKRKEKTNGLDNISKNERPTPHTNGNGLNQRNGNDEINASKGGFNALGNADTGNEYGDVADTDSRGLEGSVEVGRNCEYVIWENGTSSQTGDVADTERIRLEHSTDTGKVSGKETNAKREWNQSALPVKTNGNGYKSNWQNFPTQSPICSRNDGLSSKLDGITFSKWRNESIKAAGNAIVPQVVYQIFKAIEQYETLPRMADKI
jgi:DNA (cytosine-5)-methyltransferase 1